MTRLITDLEAAWALRRINSTVESWVLEVRKIIGVGAVETHSMGGDLHIIFSWDDGETFWRVRHVISLPLVNRIDPVALKARLATVTEAIKRTLEES